jgi:hypothetical protein
VAGFVDFGGFDVALVLGFFEVVEGFDEFVAVDGVVVVLDGVVATVDGVVVVVDGAVVVRDGAVVVRDGVVAAVEGVVVGGGAVVVDGVVVGGIVVDGVVVDGVVVDRDVVGGVVVDGVVLDEVVLDGVAADDVLDALLSPEPPRIDNAIAIPPPRSAAPSTPAIQGDLREGARAIDWPDAPPSVVGAADVGPVPTDDACCGPRMRAMPCAISAPRGPAIAESAKASSATFWNR